MEGFVGFQAMRLPVQKPFLCLFDRTDTPVAASKTNSVLGNEVVQGGITYTHGHVHARMHACRCGGRIRACWCGNKMGDGRGVQGKRGQQVVVMGYWNTFQVSLGPLFQARGPV